MSVTRERVMDETDQTTRTAGTYTRDINANQESAEDGCSQMAA